MNTVKEIQDGLLARASKPIVLDEDDVAFKLLDDLEELKEPIPTLALMNMDKAQLIDYIGKLQNIIWHI